MQPLTALITCFNEEARIADCLASVKFAEEILVVDSFSTDRTRELAGQFTDRILQHEFINNTEQYNWALTQAQHEWVLIIDADERVTSELVAEVKEILVNPECDGYRVYRRNFFLGKEIRHGNWTKDSVLRLFRRSKGRYEAQRHHASAVVDGTVGWCHAALLHYPYRNLEDYLGKLPRYSLWGALDADERGKRGDLWHIIGHSTSNFLKSYIVKRGFLDGKEGLLLAVMEGFSTFLRYTKLYEIQQHRRCENPSRQQ